MDKKCKACGIIKPLHEFYPNHQCVDGRVGKCKKCTCERVRSYRADNPDKVRCYQVNWRRSEEGKRYKLEHGRNYSAKKFNATQTARRWHPIDKPCVVCGLSKAQRHHPDYDRPTDIIWLCSRHHSHVHSGKISILPKFIEKGVRSYGKRGKLLCSKAPDSSR